MLMQKWGGANEAYIFAHSSSWKQMEWEGMLNDISQQPDCFSLTYQMLLPEYYIHQ